MMKKMWLVLALLLCTGVVFAEAKKNAIMMDQVPLFEGFTHWDSDSDINYKQRALGIGITYERNIAPNYSIGVRMDFGTWSEEWSMSFFGLKWSEKTSVRHFGLTALGRYYPLSSSMEKLFLGAGLGFESHTWKYEEVDASEKSPTITDSSSGLLLDVNMGWKHIIGPGFIVEPGLGYKVSKFNEGWYAALNVGWNF